MRKNKDIAKEERRLTDFAATLDAETVKITVVDANGVKTEKEIDAEKINEQAEGFQKCGRMAVISVLSRKAVIGNTWLFLG